MKTLLLIGSGGREHALAWKLAHSPKINRTIVAPGNDAFSADWERWKIDLSKTGSEAKAEFVRIAKLALAARVDLAVIGPDNPLAEGIVDVFEAHGIPCFGPSAAAAKLESSKAFAKDVMKAAKVPTAKFFTASNAEEARKILKSVPWRPDGGWVVKADGLALGKGVRVCSSFEDASQAATELLSVSGSLVVEEKLQGEEISWLAFCDGEHCSVMEPARDHKALHDGNRGPNTGGMGAFSPVSEVPASWEKRLKEEVFLPVLKEMKERGTPFKGVLYAGLMCDFSQDRFWVLEFNARFGDPETQVLLARMDSDLFDWCEACALGRLGEMPERVPFTSDAAVVVVGAARGYPEKPEKGRAIEGLTLSSGSGLPPYFVAGATRDQKGRWITSGGRVFGAMGLGPDLKAAREQAYTRIETVSFEGMQFRRDIAGGYR